jgi:hypothetical protein
VAARIVLVQCVISTVKAVLTASGTTMRNDSSATIV